MTLKGNYFQTSVSPLVDARDERRRVRAALSSNISTGGVYQPGDFAVAQVGAGTTLQVQIAACAQGGGAVVLGQDTHQGAYFGYSDALVTLPLAAADPTNPRIDVVILRIYDDEVTPGSGFSIALEVVRGTPAASPAVPALPRDCVALAQVRVNVGQTGITTAAITDMRRSALTKPWAVPWGVIGYTIGTADTVAFTTIIDAPGHAVAFTAIANRVYRMTYKQLLQIAGTAPLASSLEIYDTTAALVIGQDRVWCPLSNWQAGGTAIVVTTFPAGARSLKCRCTANYAGSGTTTLKSNPTFPSSFVVEDIGPVAGSTPP
jgi:hypothetical protein